MSKIQKICFVVFVSLGLICAVVGYRALKNAKQPNVKALSLLPDGCDLLLKFDNYSEFTNSLRNKNLLWQDLKTLNCFIEPERHFNYFDSVVISNQVFNNLISDNPVYFSLYPTNKFLITCNLKELADEGIYKTELNKIAGSLSLLNIKTDIQNGVVGISNSEEYLKKLFDAKNHKLSGNKTFSTFDNETNYSGLSIYLNNSIKSGYFNESYSNISLKPDRIILNGIKTLDSARFYGEINAKPLKNFDLLNNIPLVCNAFEVFVFENAETLFAKKVKNDWWEKINEKAMFDVKKQFYDNLTENLIKISMPSKNNAIVINIKDKDKLNEILPFLSDSIKLNNLKITSLVKNTSSFVSSTFPLVKTNELNYLIVFENHLVFAATESDAEIFINAKENNSSILDNKHFKQFAAKNFDAEFHYLDYKLINTLSKEDIPLGAFLKSNDFEKLKNVSHYSYMATYKNNFLNYRFNLSYFQDNFSDEPGVLWTMTTDTAISSKPFLFKNHITKGNEVVFQTCKNDIYLQNATGKTLWKKQINEQIKSDVFVVDAFKNGKYQMLFNGEKYIHLIDRNGNYVQGFPVKLPARATNKLCLLDYENKNELRLFIACADNKIYNYSIFGIKQEGFKPLETTAEVILPIRYCKIGLSDYLITADRNGKIYAFSRKGEGRISLKNKLIQDAENFEVESANLLGNAQIIYYDKKSHLVEKISLIDKKEVYTSSEGDEKSTYCFDDFDRNKIKDVIVAYSDKLEVYDLNGTRIFNRDYSDNINSSMVNFYFLNNQSLANIFDNVNSNTTIMNIDQKTTKEYKSTQLALTCDLFNDGKIYIVLVLNGELKCLKL